MFWIRSLNHYCSWFLSSPGASTHLGDQLKCAFVRSEVREVNHPVYVEDPHETHMIEVESFRYHLRTDQDIGFSFFKVLDDRFVTCLRSCGVEIHPLNLSILKMKR